MRMRVWAASVVLVLMIGGFLGVFQAIAPRAQAQAREIKIGGTMAITGAFSVEWGPKARQFMEEWAKMMNERGGVFVKEANAKLPIKLIVYDDGSSADRAVELYERLATTDKVDFFTGPASSPITIKASTVAEKYGIPMVTAEANSPAIFARGFKWLVGADRPAPQWAEDYYRMLKVLMDNGTLPRLKTVAVIQENTPHTMDVGWGAVNQAGLAGLDGGGHRDGPAERHRFLGRHRKAEGTVARRRLRGHLGGHRRRLRQAGLRAGAEAEGAPHPAQHHHRKVLHDGRGHHRGGDHRDHPRGALQEGRPGRLLRAAQEGGPVRVRRGLDVPALHRPGGPGQGHRAGGQPRPGQGDGGPPGPPL